VLVLVERRVREGVVSLSFSFFPAFLSSPPSGSSDVSVLPTGFFVVFLRAAGLARDEERLRGVDVRLAALLAITASSSSAVVSGASPFVGSSSASDAFSAVPVADPLRLRPLPPRRPRRDRLGDPAGLGVDDSPCVDSSEEVSSAPTAGSASADPAGGFLGPRADAERLEGRLPLLLRRAVEGNGGGDPDFESASAPFSGALPSRAVDSDSGSESVFLVRAAPEAGRLLRPRPPRLRGLRGAPVVEGPEPVEEAEPVLPEPSGSPAESPRESEFADDSGIGRSSPAGPAGTTGTTAVSGSSIMVLPSRECAAVRNGFGLEPVGTAESFR